MRSAYKRHDRDAGKEREHARESSPGHPLAVYSIFALLLQGFRALNPHRLGCRGGQVPRAVQRGSEKEELSLHWRILPRFFGGHDHAAGRLHPPVRRMNEARTVFRSMKNAKGFFINEPINEPVSFRFVHKLPNSDSLLDDR